MPQPLSYIHASNCFQLNTAFEFRAVHPAATCDRSIIFLKLLAMPCPSENGPPRRLLIATKVSIPLGEAVHTCFVTGPVAGLMVTLYVVTPDEPAVVCLRGSDQLLIYFPLPTSDAVQQALVHPGYRVRAPSEGVRMAGKYIC